MKKVLLVISLAGLLAVTGITSALAQQPAPRSPKDTVNMDTDAKPTQYYAIEDEKVSGESKSNTVTIIIIVGAVVVVGVGAFLLLRKKK